MFFAVMVANVNPAIHLGLISPLVRPLVALKPMVPALAHPDPVSVASVVAIKRLPVRHAAISVGKIGRLQVVSQ